MFAIVGPTASGKSGIGFELVKSNFSIVNFDSCQMYKQLPVLKAVPEDLYEHYLYQVFNHANIKNVLDWALLCKENILDIINKKRNPILIGGTGFYLKSLCEGVSCLPKISESVTQEVESLSLENVKELLNQYDPISLKFQDQRRLRRSLKIWLETKKSIFEHNTNRISFNVNVRILALLPEISSIRDNVRKRLLSDFSIMFSEVFDLYCSLNDLRKYYSIIGVFEIEQLIKSEINQQKCIDLIYFRICQYVKRQSTYIRNSLQLENVFDNPKKLFEYIKDSCH